MELHDRIMVGVRTERLSLTSCGASSARSKRTSSATRLTLRAISMFSSAWPNAEGNHQLGHRQAERRKYHGDFLHDLRNRVIGQSEISTDGFHPYRVAIRDAFGPNASHGVIVKTYSVTHLVKEAQGRYSPAAVVSVSRNVVSGVPDQYVSTSYVERKNLSLCMASRWFTRSTNGFSKKLDNHVAAVAVYVAHYNLCRSQVLLHGEFDIALGAIGLTVLAEHLSPRSLSFDQFGIVCGKQLLQVGELPSRIRSISLGFQKWMLGLPWATVLLHWCSPA
ncbi:transposase [Bradyrhizobium canariense]|uniref:transposase n=1 Tax=Bradyrhizobium canariense TaxID=255045 RepID=UPI0018E946C6|nr:transposase [Bradyrhizobium canariense]